MRPADVNATRDVAARLERDARRARWFGLALNGVIGAALLAVLVFNAATVYELREARERDAAAQRVSRRIVACALAELAEHRTESRGYLERIAGVHGLPPESLPRLPPLELGRAQEACAPVIESLRGGALP